MYLATLLRPRALSRVRTAVGREHHVATANSWDGLEGVIRALPIDVAVVDPRHDGRSGIEPLFAIRRAYASLPLLLYTRPSPETMQDIVELGRTGSHQLLIEGYEDDTARIRNQLMTMVQPELETRVIAMLEPMLRRLPAAAARAITQLFLVPQEFGSVEDLAHSAGMPRRTFDRRLHAAGLPPAHTLLVAARVLRAFVYARDPGYELADVACKMGYSDPCILTRHIRAAMGELPSAWRRTATSESVLLRLQHLLLPEVPDADVRRSHA
jgi:AraC-like DNA-binding protein